MKRIFFFLALGMLVFSSCRKDSDSRAGIFKGPAVNFQQGKAWTWIQLDRLGKPERVAIAIDEAAMNSLDTGEGGEGGHMHDNAVSLAFHPKASVTPFMHALLDWNPHGHEPVGIYDKPHFDFHFYMTSEQERMAIPPYEVDSTGFLQYPAPGYMPETYVPGPGGVPMMGTHWFDVNTPELHGQPFTETFLYGSYGGRNTFYEPMITKAFLDTHPSFERGFGVPVKFSTRGYYPTRMRILKEQGVTNIILEGFVYRQAS